MSEGVMKYYEKGLYLNKDLCGKRSTQKADRVYATVTDFR